MFPSIVKSIALLQQINGGINEIHAIGERADNILETIQKQKTAFQPNEDGAKRPIRHLILFDRSVDLTSLFVTPLSYEGLIDDLLGITMGVTSVPESMVGGVGGNCCC